MNERDELSDVIGLGNAIVDVLANVDEAFLERHDLTKGTMTLVDEERSARLYAAVGKTVKCSGGSAANTIVGLASLGSRGAYVGKVRDDDLGRVFRKDLRAAGVEYDTPPATSGPATGRCLVLVTPDAQRTMQTFLGASATLAPEDVEAKAIAAARVTYLEGYLWDPEPAKRAFLEAARAAHQAGRQVALSLSDPFCVDRHRDEFRKLVENHVDLLFANEAEIISLYRTPDFDQAMEAVRGSCEIAALTRGARGSVVVTREEAVPVAAEPVDRVVDTTGAGDLFASGFLHGWTRGDDPVACARIGGIAAAEVIGHVGARPQTPLRQLVKRALRGTERRR